MTGVLISPIRPLPPPLEDKQAVATLQDISGITDDLPDNSRQFLVAVIAGSPYLAGLLARYREIITRKPEPFLQELVDTLKKQGRQDIGEADLKRLLRQTKAQSALCIALADLAGIWPLEQVTRHLTLIADACVSVATDWLLRDAMSRGMLAGLDSENPARGCGMTILAMGKQGACELNFSSDIDLIVLFDPESAAIAAQQEAAPLYVRLTKRLVSLLQDITDDGYVYRTDLRLRPDPRATQVAISIDAAMVYYESMGQNWERAAMIKARCVAGCPVLGDMFLAAIGPFIWRKYLDFAAIAEVHALKRQIHSHKGHGEITVLGHDVKLGRGGIREIEFFVQTQQLIAGGRNEQLRGQQTLDMLDRFAGAGWISDRQASSLADAYRFLRTIEHRIQMVGDQQSHRLPSQPDSFEHFARFCGFASADQLSQKLLKVFTTVQTIYDSLFERAGDMETSGRKDMVFSGAEDDPDTLAALQDMGYQNPGQVSRTVKAWYAGRYNALRTAAARQRLEELMPDLLAGLARSGAEPDATLAAFDRFVSGLPSGVQLFSMLAANRHLLELIATILGAAPRLAEELSRRPAIFDAVIDPDFFQTLPGQKDLEAMIAARAPRSADFDEVLDQVRIIHREQMFRIGVRILSGTMDAPASASAYTRLADVIITRLAACAGAQMIPRHGRIEGGDVAIIAMGKLGGGEMTASSDLDLILVYDHAPGASQSDGVRPLGINRYFARLTQRLVSALTVPTSEGGLYEVDMRLRPSGNKGPVATSLDAFIEYQKSSAWTWEKMALTRARVIHTGSGIEQPLATAIKSALCQPCNADKIRADALAMRQTMLSEKKPQGFWDLKNPRGGIIELEFIVQVLQIIHAARCPEILNTNIARAITALGKHDIVDAATANNLLSAFRLYQSLSQVLNLGLKGEYRPETAPHGLTALVNKTAACPDTSTAESLLRQTRETVADVFDNKVGPV